MKILVLVTSMLLSAVLRVLRTGARLISRSVAYRRLQRKAAHRQGTRIIKVAINREVAMSPIEADLYNALVACGLRPVPQLCVRGYILDFGFPMIRVGIEADGAAFHGGQQRKHDQARDRHLSRSGWTILRFTGSKIRRAPDRCAAEVLRHVQQAQGKLARRIALRVSCMIGLLAFMVVWSAVRG